jgi:tripeptide aminopeptidase
MEIDKNLINIFLELVKIDGISGNEREVADYIRKFLTKFSFVIKEDDTFKFNGGNTGNLICKYGTGGNMMLMSHMDTVSSTSSLKPKVTKDRISSDGTTILGADDRAGIACILYSISKILDNGGELKDFTVVFTVDEERNLVGSSCLKPDRNIKMGIVFDSHSRPGLFICQTYGCRDFHVKIKGKSAHAGIAPEKGVNSIQIAAEAISKLKIGRVTNNTTTNIGEIKGGTAMNMVPAETEIVGEVRSLVSERVDGLIKDFRNKFEIAALKYGGEVKFRSSWAFKPYNIDSRKEVRKLVQWVIQETGLDPKASITAGGSDANNLNTKGIQAINMGIGAQNPHSVDEFILLEDLHNVAKIIQNLIKKDI